jgi:hypothetical protein
MHLLEPRTKKNAIYVLYASIYCISLCHLAPKLKKEQSYTTTPPLGLRGLFSGALYLYTLYVKISRTCSQINPGLIFRLNLFLCLRSRTFLLTPHVQLALICTKAMHTPTCSPSGGPRGRRISRLSCITLLVLYDQKTLNTALSRRVRAACILGRSSLPEAHEGSCAPRITSPLHTGRFEVGELTLLCTLNIVTSPLR